MAGPKFWGWAEPPKETDPHQEYVITWTSRPPMADAGIKRKTVVQGPAVRDVQREIRASHGKVLSTQRKRRWFW